MDGYRSPLLDLPGAVPSEGGPDAGVAAHYGDPLREQRQLAEGVGFVDHLAVGDAVALHWDWVCERLSGRALRRLQAATLDNLRAVNSLGACPPAAAFERA